MPVTNVDGHAEQLRVGSNPVEKWARPIVRRRVDPVGFSATWIEHGDGAATGPRPDWYAAGDSNPEPAD